MFGIDLPSSVSKQHTFLRVLDILRPSFLHQRRFDFNHGWNWRSIKQACSRYIIIQCEENMITPNKKGSIISWFIIFLQSECIEKYQIELCSKYDGEHDFDVILG